MARPMYLSEVCCMPLWLVVVPSHVLFGVGMRETAAEAYKQHLFKQPKALHAPTSSDSMWSFRLTILIPALQLLKHRNCNAGMGNGKQHWPISTACVH